MFKSIGLMTFALVLVILPLATVDCAEKSKTEFTLVFEYHGPASHSRGGNRAPLVGGWMDAVEKKSGGQIKFERHWGGEPVPVKEALDALRVGVIDVLSEVPHYYSGKIAIADIGIMPKNYRTYADIFDLWWNSPLGEIIDGVYQKRANAKVLHPMPFAPENFILSKKTGKIQHIDDLKGLKIRAAGGLANMTVKSLGAAPVVMIGGENYTAIQRGTLDATLLPPYCLESYKLWEVCHQVINPPIFNRCHQLVWINLDKWNALGPELQNILTTAARELETRAISYINTDEARITKISLEKGVTFYDLPLADQKKMWKAVDPVWDLYVEKCSKQGLGNEAKQVRDILQKRFNEQ